jgi:acetylornithine deacetylase/succinyl-diaminopimelate desuccinylase-like protein
LQYRLHELHRSLQPAAPHPLLGLPTLNIGRMQAGTAANVIPDECRIDIDRRVLPGDSAAPMVALVRFELERMQAAGRITGFELSAYEAPSLSPTSSAPARSSRI